MDTQPTARGIIHGMSMHFGRQIERLRSCQFFQQGSENKGLRIDPKDCETWQDNDRIGIGRVVKLVVLSQNVRGGHLQASVHLKKGGCHEQEYINHILDKFWLGAFGKKMKQPFPNRNLIY